MGTYGKFIVFEGTDGSGKSSQMKLLGQYLEEKGVECLYTHEPTESPIGLQLRACMSGQLDTDERAIAALFAADRIDHITNPNTGILRALREGKCVLCDRYYLSSFAYNGGLAPLEWVMELNRPAMELLRPDLTVYLEVPLEESMRRLARRGVKERYETEERQRKIHEGYSELVKRFQESDHIEVVKSEKDKQATAAHIRALADRLFGF